MKWIFFADVLDDDPIPGFSGMGEVMKERVLVLSAVLLVVAAVLVGVFLSRRRRRHNARRDEHRRRRHSSLTKNASRGMAVIKEFVKEKQRGQRRHHRPRNPTLAQTGGLPPIRKDAQPPPATPH